jgi:hypothetical protein
LPLLSVLEEHEPNDDPGAYERGKEARPTKSENEIITGHLIRVSHWRGKSDVISIASTHNTNKKPL